MTRLPKPVVALMSGLALLGAPCTAEPLDVKNKTMGPCSPIVSHAGGQSPSQTIVFNCIVGESKQKLSASQIEARADAFKANGFPEDAIALYTDLLKGLITAQPLPLSAKTNKKIANVHRKLADIQDPEDHLRRAVQYDPTNVAYMKDYSTWLWKSDRVDLMIKFQLANAELMYPERAAREHRYRQLLSIALNRCFYNYGTRICTAARANAVDGSEDSCFSRTDDANQSLRDQEMYRKLQSLKGQPYDPIGSC